MKGNAARCIANTLVYEGGLTMDRNDPGNWTGGKVGVGELHGTKYGIAANTYPRLDIRNLSKDDAIAIYQCDWWPRVAGDDMPKGVDQIAYDGAVNSGPARGLRWVGDACGAKSSAAAEVARAASAAPDKVKLIKQAISNRMSFLRGLGNYTRYGGGWSRRCAGMEAIAVKMALEVIGIGNMKGRLQDESTEAGTSSKKNTGKAAASAAPTAAPAAAPEGSFDTTAWIIIGAAVVGLLVVTAIYAWRAYRDRQRAIAYAAVADGTSELE